VLDPVFFPPPTLVLSVLLKASTRSEVIGSLFLTVVRFVLGFALSAFIAVSLGMVLGVFDGVRVAMEGIIEVLRPLPSTAVIPVGLILLGIGEKMHLAVTIFGACWPTLVSTIESVRRVDGVLIDVGRTLDFNRWQLFRYIIMPAAVPGILTGMRISLAIALILTITIEMVVGGGGIGGFIVSAQRSFMYPEMFCGIFCAGVLGFAANWLFVLLTRLNFAWVRKMEKNS
jgi:ABC-type nitrate/sulfonate/bicarbonate transport system permease component